MKWLIGPIAVALDVGQSSAGGTLAPAVPLVIGFARRDGSEAFVTRYAAKGG